MAFDIGERVTNSFTGPGTVLGGLVWDSPDPAERSALQRVKFDHPLIGERDYPIARLQTLEVENEIKPPKVLKLKSKIRRPNMMTLTGSFDPFIDFLSQHSLIRVQVPPSGVVRFQKLYQDITGQVVDFPSEFASEVSGQSKWGLSITVLFPSEGLALVPAGLTVGKNDISDTTESAIFSNEFGWALFAKGFRLGHNRVEKETHHASEGSPAVDSGEIFGQSSSPEGYVLSVGA